MKSLLDQKNKIHNLSLRMIKWAEKFRVPTKNGDYKIPVIKNEDNVRDWKKDFKWVNKKDRQLDDFIQVQESVSQKHPGAIEVHGLTKKEMEKANFLYKIYDPDFIFIE